MKTSKLRRILCITLAVILVLAAAVDLFAGNYLVNFAIRRSSAAGAAAMPTPVTTDDTKQTVRSTSAALWEETMSWLDKVPRETVWITSDDGLNLAGELITGHPDSHRWAISVHGYTSQRAHMYSFAYLWDQNGFNVLCPDLRAHGESEGDYIGMGWPDRLDLLLWIRDILQRDPEAEIILQGISMGGATVMMTSGESLPSNVKAIVEDCGYTSVWDIFSDELKYLFHLPDFPFLYTATVFSRLKAGYFFGEASALEQVRKTQVPILFIHGSEDNFVHTDMIYRVYDACPTEKDYFIVEGAGHGDSLYKDPDYYFGRVMDFVGNYLSEA